MAKAKKQPKENQIVVGSSSSKVGSKLGLIIFVLVLLVVVIVGGLVLSTGKTKAPKTDSNKKTAVSTIKNVCYDDVVATLNAQINNSDFSGLYTSTQTIKQKPNYQQDPNCMYGLVKYDIFTNDDKNGTTDLYTLKKLLDTNPKFIYSSQYNPRPESITYLDNMLNIVKSNNRTYEQADQYRAGLDSQQAESEKKN